MSPKSVVLLGDVGMGKSTLVEKVTGVCNLSSDASISFTRSSHAFVTKCKRLQLIDTPGSNAMQDKLEHNVWIAHALNLDPVYRILLVVKADTRIDNSVDRVRNYAERFGDLIDIMSVCVTHMDTVTWQTDEFMNCMRDELGIDSAIFVGTATSGDQILNDILGTCEKPLNLTITSDNFLKYFKINNNNIKILKSVRQEITNFQNMNREFMTELRSGSYNAQDKTDMVFEFQAFMGQEVYEAQKRVSEANSFTFIGDNTANEAGHIANLTNQLRAVLLEVRTVALGYQEQSGISELRKCPHCPCVWAKLEGCDGATTCGNKVSNFFDGRFTSFANFSFEYDGKHLRISKVGTRPASASAAGHSSRNAGCGRPIAWRDMAPVQVPKEFNVATVVTTDDVGLVPAKAKTSWEAFYGAVETRLGNFLKTEVV